MADRVWWPCVHCDRKVSLIGAWDAYFHDREHSDPANHKAEPAMPAKATPAELEAWLAT